MNVSCTSCSAKYAIPDEKIRGKKVKITCKHCGTGIIVDGTKIGTGASASAAPAAPTAAVAAPPAPVAAPAASAAPAPAKLGAVPVPAATPAAVPPPVAAPTLAREADWTFDIAYPDDRQETLTIREIVDKYSLGALDDDAFIWREGMTDWKAPFDIPAIASALRERGLTKRPARPATTPFSDDDEATRVQDSPFDAPEGDSSQGVWREPAKEAPSNPAAAFALTERSALPFEKPEAVASPNPAAVSPKPAAVAAVAPREAPKAVAARRGRARGGGDLFGDLAGAGSEEDDSLGVEAGDLAPKMTGARNESSVLFSLDALVQQEKSAAKKPVAKPVDAAAFLMGTDSAPSSIANVGTGSFGSAFAAPDFTAPVVAPPPEPRASDPVELPSASQPKKKGLGLWLGIAAVVALAGGAFATGLPTKLGLMPPPPESAIAATQQQPARAVTPASAPEPAAPAESAASSAAPAASAAPATPAAAAAKPAEAVAKPGEAVAKPAEAVAKPADQPAKPPDAAATPADKPAAPADDAPPFDKAAAIAALGAAAGSAQSCKTPDGPTGSGKVAITFMPSGRATNTQVSGDLAGSAVGGCVARVFRKAKIPAFSGEAVTVSKSFSVQ